MTYNYNGKILVLPDDLILRYKKTNGSFSNLDIHCLLKYEKQENPSLDVESLSPDQLSAIISKQVQKDLNRVF